MKKYLIFIFIIVLLNGCATSDYQSLVSATVNKNPSLAFKNFAKNKSIQYAKNPQNLSNDLKFLLNFKENISKSWGKQNIEIPKKKKYVKYMQNYKSRTSVDFDKGLITVETLGSKKNLKDAIVTTLLLPEDPRGANLFNAKEIKLGAKPYLFGEVKDDQNKDIRYSWRANRYADILLDKNYYTKNIKKDNKSIKVHFVKIPMTKNHSDIRVTKFKPIIKKYAKKYGISENLIYAIIKTESNFNQFAVSGAGAFGLMQIVPTSAGVDAYKYVKGKNWIPTKSYLFNSQNNIELGVAYINILDKRYLSGISNPISREYCVISAYNTGSGNVLKTFHQNTNKAKSEINSQTASSVYNKLRSNLPYDETRRYLKKVIEYKKIF